MRFDELIIKTRSSASSVCIVSNKNSPLLRAASLCVFDYSIELDTQSNFYTYSSQCTNSMCCPFASYIHRLSGGLGVMGVHMVTPPRIVS